MHNFHDLMSKIPKLSLKKKKTYMKDPSLSVHWGMRKGLDVKWLLLLTIVRTTTDTFRLKLKKCNHLKALVY